MADTKTKTNETKTSINTSEKISPNKDFNSLDSLFNQEKELVNSMKDEQMKKIAQDEYDEMINRYKEEREKVKSDIKKESKLILDDLKKEFSSDIKSVEKINKLDFLSSLDWFDTFKNLISAKEKNWWLPDSIKEQLLNIFENADDTELESYFTMELWSNIVDLKWAKDFIEYFKKSTWLYKEEVNKILNLDFEKLSDNEKEYYLKEINKYKEQISADKRKELEKKLKVKTYNEVSKVSNETGKVSNEKLEYAESFIKEIQDLDLVNNSKINNTTKELLNNLLNTEIGTAKNLEIAEKLMDHLTKNTALLREFIQAIPADKRQAFIDNFTNFVKSNAIENKDQKSIELADNFKIEARKHIDIVIDAWKTTIVWENWYKLEVAYSSKELQKIMQDPINVMSNTERAEFTDKKIELKTQINELDDKIISLDDTIEKVKLLKELQKNPEANKENIQKLEEILWKIEILKEVHSIEELESKKYELVKNKEEKTSELENLEISFHNELENRFKKESIKWLEDEEKTRQTTLLLDSIWFTLIPQHITDDIIASINKNPEHYWFESRIDLKNWNFGWINTIATKERFIKKFNKMISGKEWEPITKDEIDNILVKKLERDKDSQEEKNKELINKFSTYNIMSDLWTWDREKLENNLNIKEKENTQTEK